MPESPWPRRIVVCCDGTWQSSVTSKDNIPSNVTKLARHIKRIGTDSNGNNYHQIVYYDSGIGTGSLSWLEKSRQGGLGDGLAENVIEAYNFIVLNYQPGDEIFCFGFSRGAYTARAVAGLICDIGVLEPSDMEFFPELYRGYMHKKEGEKFKNTKAWEDYKARVSAREVAKGKLPGNHVPATKIDSSVKVKVVGVWDTVGSLGIPDGRFSDHSSSRKDYGFHNVKLSRDIEHAFHALALDERRKAFGPTLWYIPYDDVKQGGDLPELKQVWFPGFHINVGGGSDDGIKEMHGDMEAMANVTFAWMLQCISPYLTIDMDVFKNHLIDYQVWLDEAENRCTRHHPSQEGYSQWAYHKVSGTHSDEARSKAHTHTIDRGWGTGPMPDSLAGIMYKWAGPEQRKPGNCKVDVWKGSTYVPTSTREVGITNEYIHPVTAYRQFDYNNAPKQEAGFFTSKISSTPPLKDLTKPQIPFEKKEHKIEGRILVEDERVKAKQYYWQKDDVLLPEWVILDHMAGQVDFERMWLNGGDGKAGDESKWLKTLDVQLKDTFDVIRQNMAAYPGVIKN